MLRERYEKSGELFTTFKSLEKARKKMKKLKASRDVIIQKDEEVESKVSTTEEEFIKCDGVSLPIPNASNDIEKMKQVLEVSLQDLVNYKLCLD